MQLIGGEDGSFDTGPSIVPLAVFDPDTCHAAEADAETAGHRSFE